MISLFNPIRYSADAGVMTSGIGLMVTVVACDAEVKGAVFVAVTLTPTTVGTNWFAGRIGAVKLILAPVGGSCVTVNGFSVPAGT